MQSFTERPRDITEIRRQISPEGAEIPSYTPIDNLFVLVHPLDEALGTEVVYTRHIRKVREQLFRTALQRFVPVTQKEVLVVVPNGGTTIHDFRHEVLTTQIEMEVFGTPYSWISLYQMAEAMTPYKRNVLLGENVPDIEVPSRCIEERLRMRGFSINAETVITVGGELIENCVADTVGDFLTLPQVQFVQIDRLTTLGITDYVRQGPMPERSIVTAVKRLRARGLVVSSDGGEYIRVERP